MVNDLFYFLFYLYFLFLVVLPECGCIFSFLLRMLLMIFGPAYLGVGEITAVSSEIIWSGSNEIFMT